MPRPPRLTGRDLSRRLVILRQQAARRPQAGPTTSAPPQRPLPLSSEMDVELPDFPDFQTDFDETELAERLNNMRDDVDLTNEHIALAHEEGDSNTALTAQDEELAPMAELEDLADLQLVDEPHPFEDEAEELLDLTTDAAEQAALQPPAIQSNPELMSEIAQGKQPVPVSDNPLHNVRKTPIHKVDESVVQGVHRKYELLPNAHMAIGIWCKLEKISDKAYKTLRETLQSQVAHDPDLATLPASVTTLTKQVTERLPLLELRKTKIELDASKLTTARAERLDEGEVPSQDMYFFNLMGYLKILLTSTLKDAMHFGYAELVEAPTEPWHTQAWASSIRASGGSHPRYKNDVEEPIFQSDFVEYNCHDDKCMTCSTGGKIGVHRGRVTEIWQDERTPVEGEHNFPKGAIIANVEPIMSMAVIRTTFHAVLGHIEGFPKPDEAIPENEVVLVKDQKTLIHTDNILRRIPSVYIDYSFGSSVQLPADPVDTPQTDLLIRRKYNLTKKRIFPVGKSNPVRGAIEIDEFTREALVLALVHRNDNAEVWAVALILFADGFGLYRTLHKSIMGIYVSIASLCRSDRLRQMNIMPATLGPHASDDEEVWLCIGKYIRMLEEGFQADIHGHKVFILGFVWVIVGDFPAQQDNSGFRRPTATQGCRHCTVTLTKRGDLDFDLSSGRNGRYHPEVLRQRDALEEMKKEGKSKTAIESKSKEFGMADGWPALLTVLPGLDIVRTRPADPAHSEFGGITKMLHLLIVSEVFTPKGMTEYAKVLRKFPMFPGWSSLQSPNHVLQYSLTEHGQWSAIMPLITRTWLKAHSNFMKKPFRDALRKIFADEVNSGLDEADILTIVLRENFHTNVVLTADRLPNSFHDREKIEKQIKLSRTLFQRFCKAVMTQAESQHRRSSRARESRQGSVDSTGSAGDGLLSALPTVASGTAALDAGQQAVQAAVLLQSVEDIEDPRTAMQSASATTVKSAKYKLWISRPNVHIGLHYPEVMEEYALASIVMVLDFEAKHKLFKGIIYHTNHRSPEKDLLSWENFAQTLRLVLLNGYTDDDMDANITRQIKKLHKDIPNMFKSILSGTSIQGLTDATEIADPAALVTLNSVVNDNKHNASKVLGKLKEEKCREFNLPMRGRPMDEEFRTSLTQAYALDYVYPVTLSLSGTGFKWWKSVSWDTEAGKHIVKTRGQYVLYNDNRGGQPPRLGRLDQIMTHEAIAGQRIRVFLMVSPVHQATAGVDVHTGLPYYQHEQQRIIGFWAVRPETMFVVPFVTDDNGNWHFVQKASEHRDANNFNALHVNWNLSFM